MDRRVGSFSGYGLALLLAFAFCSADLQAQNIPEGYFAGVTLSAPLPTQVRTGETILLKGHIDDPTIPEISFIYSRSSGGGIREFRVVVVDGRFEQRIFFGHSEAGEYFLEVWFFPAEGPGKTSIRYPSIRVAQGSGPIEVPPEYYHNLIDRAFFAPNVASADSGVLPPFYVRAGGQVVSVTAFLQVDGEQRAFAMRDDGQEGDRVAGDGTYTRLDLPFATSELSLGKVGDLRATAQIVFADGRVVRQTAECGLVAAGDHPLPVRLGLHAVRTEHVLNLIDKGDLFRASGRVPSNVVGHGFSNEYGIDLRRASAYFYEHFADEYDFLVIRSAHSLINGVHGVNFNVKNEVEGIGLAPRDESELWGSAGHLKSALFINFRLMGPLIHELAHNWANYLELFENARWGGHWGISDVRGVLGGNVTDFEKIEAGVYAVDADAPASFWSGRYANLELYLMGLVPAAEVPEHHLIRDFSVVGFDEDRNKVLLQGRVDTVRVEDIIRRMGERVPAYEISQKAFRMGTIVVSFAPLSALELAYYDHQTQLLASDADSDYAFAAATGGRATLDTRLDPMITAVREEQRAVDGLPTLPMLMQNVPNPFNSSTAIEYALPERGEVELAIYNAVGQQVVVLEKGVRLAGHHTARWDGKDAQGRALASGVYFYQLRTTNGSERRKLSLIQ